MRTMKRLEFYPILVPRESETSLWEVWGRIAGVAVHAHAYAYRSCAQLVADDLNTLYVAIQAEPSRPMPNAVDHFRDAREMIAAINEAPQRTMTPHRKSRKKQVA